MYIKLPRVSAIFIGSIILALSLLLFPVFSFADIYVDGNTEHGAPDHSPSDTNTGENWTHAVATLERAIELIGVSLSRTIHIAGPEAYTFEENLTNITIIGYKYRFTDDGEVQNFENDYTAITAVGSMPNGEPSITISGSIAGCTIKGLNSLTGVQEITSYGTRKSIISLVINTHALKVTSGSTIRIGNSLVVETSIDHSIIESLTNLDIGTTVFHSEIQSIAVLVLRGLSIDRSSLVNIPSLNVLAPNGYISNSYINYATIYVSGAHTAPIIQVNDSFVYGALHVNIYDVSVRAPTGETYSFPGVNVVSVRGGGNLSIDVTVTSCRDANCIFYVYKANDSSFNFISTGNNVFANIAHIYAAPHFDMHVSSFYDRATRSVPQEVIYIIDCIGGGDNTLDLACNGANGNFTKGVVVCDNSKLSNLTGYITGFNFLKAAAVQITNNSPINPNHQLEATINVYSNTVAYDESVGATGKGAAFYLDKSSDCVFYFRRCQIYDNVLSAPTDLVKGGAFYVKDVDKLKLENCWIFRNQANEGAALYIDSAASPMNRLFIGFCTFSSNKCIASELTPDSELAPIYLGKWPMSSGASIWNSIFHNHSICSAPYNIYINTEFSPTATIDLIRNYFYLPWLMINIPDSYIFGLSSNLVVPLIDPMPNDPLVRTGSESNDLYEYHLRWDYSSRLDPHAREANICIDNALHTYTEGATTVTYDGTGVLPTEDVTGRLAADSTSLNARPFGWYETRGDRQGYDLGCSEYYTRVLNPQVRWGENHYKEPICLGSYFYTYDYHHRTDPDAPDPDHPEINQRDWMKGAAFQADVHREPGEPVPVPIGDGWAYLSVTPEINSEFAFSDSNYHNSYTVNSLWGYDAGYWPDIQDYWITSGGVDPAVIRPSYGARVKFWGQASREKVLSPLRGYQPGVPGESAFSMNYAPWANYYYLNDATIPAYSESLVLSAQFTDFILGSWYDCCKAWQLIIWGPCDYDASLTLDDMTETYVYPSGIRTMPIGAPPVRFNSGEHRIDVPSSISALSDIRHGSTFSVKVVGSLPDLTGFAINDPSAAVNFKPGKKYYYAFKFWDEPVFGSSCYGGRQTGKGDSLTTAGLADITSHLVVKYGGRTDPYQQKVGSFKIGPVTKHIKVEVRNFETDPYVEYHNPSTINFDLLNRTKDIKISNAGDFATVLHLQPLGWGTIGPPVLPYGQFRWGTYTGILGLYFHPVFAVEALERGGSHEFIEKQISYWRPEAELPATADTSTLTIRSDDPDENPFILTLVGPTTGGGEGGINIDMGTEHTFITRCDDPEDSYPSPNESPHTFTLTNTSTTDSVTISSITLSDAVNFQFRIAAGSYSGTYPATIPFTLDPGATMAFDVVYTGHNTDPSAPDHGTITATPSDSGVTAATVSISGYTVIAPRIHIEPASGEFSAPDTTMTFTITNTGCAPLRINSISGPLTPPFSFGSIPFLPTTLPADGVTSITFTVTYAGSDTPVTQTVHVASNDPISPVTDVPVSNTASPSGGEGYFYVRPGDTTRASNDNTGFYPYEPLKTIKKVIERINAYTGTVPSDGSIKVYIGPYEYKSDSALEHLVLGLPDTDWDGDQGIIGLTKSDVTFIGVPSDDYTTYGGHSPGDLDHPYTATPGVIRIQTGSAAGIGVDIGPDCSNTTVKNMVITDNSVCAIQVAGSDVRGTGENLVITDNGGDGVYVHDGAQAIVYNSIIVKNTGTGVNVVAGEGTAVATEDFNDVWGNGTNYTDGHDIGDHDFFARPFLDLTGTYPYAVKAKSLCVATGRVGGVPTGDIVNRGYLTNLPDPIPDYTSDHSNRRRPSDLRHHQTSSHSDWMAPGAKQEEIVVGYETGDPFSTSKIPLTDPDFPINTMISYDDYDSTAEGAVKAALSAASIVAAFRDDGGLTYIHNDEHPGRGLRVTVRANTSLPQYLFNSELNVPLRECGEYYPWIGLHLDPGVKFVFKTVDIDPLFPIGITVQDNGKLEAIGQSGKYVVGSEPRVWFDREGDETGTGVWKGIEILDSGSAQVSNRLDYVKVLHSQMGVKQTNSFVSSGEVVTGAQTGLSR